MALTFTREPKNMLDPNTWGVYEKAQNRRILGSLTAFLYSAGANNAILRISKGIIGIDTDDIAGTINIGIAMPTSIINMAIITSGIYE